MPTYPDYHKRSMFGPGTAIDLIFDDEDAWFENHIANRHESCFFANLTPGMPVMMPTEYCPECVTNAAITVAERIAA